MSVPEVEILFNLNSNCYAIFTYFVINRDFQTPTTVVLYYYTYSKHEDCKKKKTLYMSNQDRIGLDSCLIYPDTFYACAIENVHLYGIIILIILITPTVVSFCFFQQLINARSSILNYYLWLVRL